MQISRNNTINAWSFFSDCKNPRYRINSPTEVRGKELSSPAYLNLYENIQAYFHIVHVETDTDFIGFELFKNIETKTYFKYDDTFILPSINTVDILNTPHQAYCHVSIQLTEQILTLKRSNTKLTEVLGEVGGLMEVIFSLFRIISSFLTDNLYEQSLVNNLFTFDLDKKIIKIKEKKKNNNFSENEDIKIYNNLKISPTLSQKTLTINDEPTINTKNKLYDAISNNTNANTNNDNLLVSRNLKSQGKKKKGKSKINLASNLGKFNSSVKSKFSFLNKNENETNIYKEKDVYNNDGNNIIISNPNEVKDNEKEKENTKDSDERKIVDKIKISKWRICFCFLCARRFKNIQNILLDEGMRLIIEKLDIIYLFKKIIKEDKITENYDFKNIELMMSDECKQRLQKMYNSYFGLLNS